MLLFVVRFSGENDVAVYLKFVSSDSKCVQTVMIYTVSDEEKIHLIEMPFGMMCWLGLSSANIDRFSKFFQGHIFGETKYGAFPN